MATDFTKGKVTPELIRFTIPLVLGNLFQLLYNAVDSVIVGRYVGKEALAAVGTSNPLMTLVILFFNGITLGAGILIGNHYGARSAPRCWAAWPSPWRSPWCSFSSPIPSSP